MDKVSRAPQLENIHDAETALLVDLLRMPLSADRAADVLRKRGAKVDWERLLRLALFHRVSPLLYTVLKGSGASAVPSDILSRLDSHCTNNAARSLHLTAELLEAIRCLEDRGIPVVPFKGPVTSLNAYDSLGLREFGDLDVLIHARQFPEAIRALTDAGYSVDPEVESLEQHLSRLHEVRLLKMASGQPILLELHWRLAPGFWHVPLTSEELLAQSVPAELLDREIRVLPPELEFLVACVGGAKTCFQYMDNVCQLAAVIAKGTIDDWARLDDQAAELGLSRALHLGVALATLMLGAKDASKLMPLLEEDPSVSGLARNVLDRWKDPWRDNRPYEWTGFQLRVRERLRDRLPYLKNRLMTLGRPRRPNGASFGFLDLLCLPVSLVRGTWLFLHIMMDRHAA